MMVKTPTLAAINGAIDLLISLQHPEVIKAQLEQLAVAAKLAEATRDASSEAARELSAQRAALQDTQEAIRLREESIAARTSDLEQQQETLRLAGVAQAEEEIRLQGIREELAKQADSLKERAELTAKAIGELDGKQKAADERERAMMSWETSLRAREEALTAKEKQLREILGKSEE